MDADVTDKPIIALPPYNDYRVGMNGEAIDMAQACAIARRILELGVDHAYTKETRSPTAEERAAFREGRLTGYHRDKPRDRYDDLIIVYVRGAVEQAFEEAGVETIYDADRRKVDLFLAEVRDAKAKAALDANRVAFDAGLEDFLAAHPQTPAVERYIRRTCVFGKSGARVPDLAPADWADRLNRVTNPYGGATTADAPYQPEPSGYRLRTAERVSLTYSQEQYADYSTYIIPVEKIAPTDPEAAKRNLAKIGRKLQTHNGWAGSGSTHSFSLHDEEDGCYVLMMSRHSISD